MITSEIGSKLFHQQKDCIPMKCALDYAEEYRSQLCSGPFFTIPGAGVPK